MTRNTNGNFGQAVAAPNKSMQDGDWINDTRKPKWTVSLDEKEPHLKLLDDFSGGTIKTYLTADSGTEFRETLYEIRHKMPWPPKFLCYFYTIDAPTGYSGNIGRYALNTAYMMYNEFPYGTEGLYAEVDETFFRIVHFISVGAIPSSPGTKTYYGSGYKFRVKYEILNQKALFLGGQGF